MVPLLGSRLREEGAGQRERPKGQTWFRSSGAVYGRKARASARGPRLMVSGYCAGTAAARLVPISNSDLRTAIM